MKVNIRSSRWKRSKVSWINGSRNTRC